MENIEKNEGLLLEVNDLCVEYVTHNEVVHAVNGLNLKLGYEKTLGLVGETGAGKTTTAKAILNLVPNPPGVIRRGEIILDGKNVLEMPESELEKMRGKDVAIRILGIAAKISMIRMIRFSTAPPTKPATAPSVTPASRETITATTPIARE